MSEFKYACPVCGQHMRCDSSQAGTVMDCPTCFQKITAPQAPASADQKFILTGSKVVEKKATVSNVAAPAPPAADNKFLLAAAVVVVLVLSAGAALVIHKNNSKPEWAKNQPVVANQAVKAPAKPALVAPPANDTNWLLALGTNAIPDTPVAGRIHAQDFIAERVSFQNGLLTLRQGRGQFEFGVQVNFGGAQPEALSGKAINVMTNADKAAKVTLRWKDAGGTVQKENYDDRYAMRLEFGELANNRLPGKIWLCTPDNERSYLLGTFNADARKPKPKAPKK